MTALPLKSEARYGQWRGPPRQSWPQNAKDVSGILREVQRNTEKIWKDLKRSEMWNEFDMIGNVMSEAEQVQANCDWIFEASASNPPKKQAASIPATFYVPFPQHWTDPECCDTAFSMKVARWFESEHDWKQDDIVWHRMACVATQQSAGKRAGFSLCRLDPQDSFVWVWPLHHLAKKMLLVLSRSEAVNRCEAVVHAQYITHVSSSSSTLCSGLPSVAQVETKVSVPAKLRHKAGWRGLKRRKAELWNGGQPRRAVLRSCGLLMSGACFAATISRDRTCFGCACMDLTTLGFVVLCSFVYVLVALSLFLVCGLVKFFSF